MELATGSGPRTAPVGDSSAGGALLSLQLLLEQCEALRDAVGAPLAVQPEVRLSEPPYIVTPTAALPGW